MGGQAVRRAERWDEALFTWMEHRLGRPFEWGVTDCAMLCIEAHDVITGTDLAKDYRGQWSTAAGARKFQLRHDTDLCRWLERHGSIPVAPNFQQRGDIILAPQDSWWCGHVCLGTSCLSSHLENGVQLVPAAAILALPGARVLRPA